MKYIIIGLVIMISGCATGAGRSGAYYSNAFLQGFNQGYQNNAPNRRVNCTSYAIGTSVNTNCQ